MVTYEKQRNTELTNNQMFPENQSWIDYRALTQIGLSANIDRKCNCWRACWIQSQKDHHRTDLQP